MRSLANIDEIPFGSPLLAEDLTEYHAARILLLLRFSGIKDSIEGLTKLAKLDFFVRYPKFFERACEHLGKEYESVPDHDVETRMVRFHYGPWDKRYYQILGYLEARGLISIVQIGDSYDFFLTPSGAAAVDELRDTGSFDDVILQMRQVKRVFGRQKGSSLKKLIYKLFDEEVGRLKLGTVIEP